jgi:hypothetical protein
MAAVQGAPEGCGPQDQGRVIVTLHAIDSADHVTEEEGDRICEMVLALTRALAEAVRPVVALDRNGPSPVYQEFERLLGISDESGDNPHDGVDTTRGAA